MYKPIISCIIPVYNHASTLERCVLSLFKQAHRPLEIVVVNDGSTDDFAEVIKRLSGMVKKETEIKFTVLNQTNSGAPVARNNGFAKSTGEYVIFWDADTIAQPKMLEKMLEVLAKNPNASYVYSQFKFGWKKFGCGKFDAKKLKEFNYIDISSLLRRQDFSGFDKSLKRFMDWDLWLTLLEQNKTGVFLPEVLYKRLVAKKRKGISSWLPSFMYKLAVKNKKVIEYEKARQIIIKKHDL